MTVADLVVAPGAVLPQDAERAVLEDEAHPLLGLVAAFDLDGELLAVADIDRVGAEQVHFARGLAREVEVGQLLAFLAVEIDVGLVATGEAAGDR